MSPTQERRQRRRRQRMDEPGENEESSTPTTTTETQPNPNQQTETQTQTQTQQRRTPCSERIEKRRRRRNERIQNRTTTADTANENVGSSDNDSDCPGAGTDTNEQETNNEDSNENKPDDNEKENTEIPSENNNSENEQTPENEGDGLGPPPPRIERDDPNEESGRDVVGQLRSHPMSLHRLSGIGATPRDSSAEDYIPPESTPGAFWQMGRGVGDLPAWFGRRGSTNTRRSSSSSLPRAGSNVRVIPVRQVTTFPFSRVESFESNISGLGSFSMDRLSHSSGSSQNVPGGSVHSSTTPTVFLARPRSRANFWRESVRNLFRRQSTLPEAEALDAEKVVYAIVQDDEDEPFFCSWEMFLYTTAVLFVGIAIGRFTASPPGHFTAVAESIPEILSVTK